MKKIVAIALALVLLVTLSVSAFAEKSPELDQKSCRVVVVYNANSKLERHDIVDVSKREPLTFTAKPEKETDVFDYWTIYRKDGTQAVENTDYILVKGTIEQVAGASAVAGQPDNGSWRVAGTTVIKGTEITIIPLTDLIVTANYNSVLTDIKAAVASFDTTSQPTGDFVVPTAVCVLVLAAMGILVSKKQLAK